MKRILLAEDEEHIAKLIEFKLSREGFAVTIARNGQEALTRLSEAGETWSLLILDVMMPIFDGWQVLKELRQTNRKMPVLMLTAKSGEIDVARSAELGATRFLKKPFDPAELARIVKQTIDEPADGAGEESR